jgi:ribosomal protein L24E
MSHKVHASNTTTSLSNCIVNRHVKSQFGQQDGNASCFEYLRTKGRVNRAPGIYHESLQLESIVIDFLQIVAQPFFTSIACTLFKTSFETSTGTFTGTPIGTCVHRHWFRIVFLLRGLADRGHVVAAASWTLVAPKQEMHRDHSVTKRVPQVQLQGWMDPRSPQGQQQQVPRLPGLVELDQGGCVEPRLLRLKWRSCTCRLSRVSRTTGYMYVRDTHDRSWCCSSRPYRKVSSDEQPRYGR